MKESEAKQKLRQCLTENIGKSDISSVFHNQTDKVLAELDSKAYVRKKPLDFNTINKWCKAPIVEQIRTLPKMYQVKGYGPLDINLSNYHDVFEYGVFTIQYGNERFVRDFIDILNELANDRHPIEVQKQKRDMRLKIVQKLVEAYIKDNFNGIPVYGNVAYAHRHELSVADDLEVTVRYRKTTEGIQRCFSTDTDQINSWLMETVTPYIKLRVATEKYGGTKCQI